MGEYDYEDLVESAKKELEGNSEDSEEQVEQEDIEEPEEEQQYEIVPMSPLRKMEKRMETLERDTVTHKDLKEMFNIVRANQQAVDEIISLNRNMIESVSELTLSVSNIASKVSDFISRIEVEELPPAKEVRGMTDFNERLEKMENRLNALILALSPRVKKPIQQKPPVQNRPQVNSPMTRPLPA